jgi:Antibiotic biosynthesis monooxygenase
MGGANVRRSHGERVAVEQGNRHEPINAETSRSFVMPSITTIVHFSLPKENMDELLVIWKKIRDIMLNQPGGLDGVFYRTIDDDSAFQFVNVARWESAEALANALKRGQEEGSDLWTLNQELGRLAPRVSQNNYVPEVKY